MDQLSAGAVGDRGNQAVENRPDRVATVADRTVDVGGELEVVDRLEIELGQARRGFVRSCGERDRRG